MLKPKMMKILPEIICIYKKYVVVQNTTLLGILVCNVSKIRALPLHPQSFDSSKFSPSLTSWSTTDNA